MSRTLIGIVVLCTLPSVAASQEVFIAQSPEGMTGGVVGGVTVFQGGPIPIPQRDARPPATGTSVIRGRILDSATGTPLRKAIVRISGSEIREMRSTSTDAEGRYEFTDLPAGRVTVMASKAGFVDVFSQAGPLEGGKTVQLAERQTAEKIDLQLVRGSVITGRVLDEFGEPVADVQVMPMRDQFTPTGRQPAMAGRGDMTNDIGEFRLFGLAPGRYYLSATYRQMMMNMGAGSDSRNGYAPTYYPGTPSLADAQPLTLAAGENIPDVTLMLVAARTARISGIAIDRQGQPVTQGAVMVMARSGANGMSTTMGGSIQPDGTFVLSGIPPGEYVLRATGFMRMGGRPPDFMTAVVSVNGEDVNGVRLEPVSPVTVTGRVIVDPAAARSFKPEEFLFGATASNPMDQMMIGPSAPPEPVQADLTFTFQANPGTILVRPMKAANGWMITAVSLNGVDVTDGLTLRNEDVSGLEIELTNRIPEVSGLVTNERGEPAAAYSAIAFLQDSDRWSAPGPGRSAMVRPDQEGRFRFRTLRPGDYYIAAVEHLQTGQWMDPEFLESIRARATRVSIAEGETKTQDLKLIPDR